MSERGGQGAEKVGPWIPVAQGFLCDPRAAEGRVVVRDGVAYWLSATSNEEYILDLTSEARAEAGRRNARRTPPDLSAPTTNPQQPELRERQEDADV